MARESKLVALSQLVAKFLRQVHEVQASTKAEDALRIVEREDEHLVIQVVGKNAFFKRKPTEIMLDEELFERFSRQDVRTITYLACQPSKPKYKIVMQEFAEKIGKMVFFLKSHDEKSLAPKTAAEISLDKTVLQELTQEDAHLVGYTTASELHQQEAELKREAKKAAQQELA